MEGHIQINLSINKYGKQELPEEYWNITEYTNEANWEESKIYF